VTMNVCPMRAPGGGAHMVVQRQAHHRIQEGHKLRKAASATAAATSSSASHQKLLLAILPWRVLVLSRVCNSYPRACPFTSLDSMLPEIQNSHHPASASLYLMVPEM
jgi:hypothetical protein